jgi:hypothetical protein
MLSGTSDLTKRPYARSTINGRLRILALFYSWCAQRGLIAGVPFTTGELAVGRTRAPQMLAHIDARGGREGQQIDGASYTGCREHCRSRRSGG